jgi:hypothetical protein
MDRKILASLVLTAIAALFSLISAANTHVMKKHAVSAAEHAHHGVGSPTERAISGAGKWGSADTGITLDVFAGVCAVAALVLAVLSR